MHIRGLNLLELGVEGEACTATEIKKGVHGVTLRHVARLIRREICRFYRDYTVPGTVNLLPSTLYIVTTVEPQQSYGKVSRLEVER